MRLDSSGNKIWDKSFGGTEWDGAYALRATADGGAVIGGFSHSPVSGNKSSEGFGNLDFWVVRVDSLGEKLWDKSYGGSSSDVLFGLDETLDGGYVLAGSSRSAMDGNKTSPNFGDNDYWVVRLDSSGNKVWDRAFGGKGDDTAFAVVKTKDGGFILGGNSNSDRSGNLTNSHGWIVRVDQNGEKLVEQSFGVSVRALRQTSDGGL